MSAAVRILASRLVQMRQELHTEARQLTELQRSVETKRTSVQQVEDALRRLGVNPEEAAADV